jgi:hypothetical protein
LSSRVLQGAERTNSGEAEAVVGSLGEVLISVIVSYSCQKKLPEKLLLLIF